MIYANVYEHKNLKKYFISIRNCFKYSGPSQSMQNNRVCKAIGYLFMPQKRPPPAECISSYNCEFLQK